MMILPKTKFTITLKFRRMVNRSAATGATEAGQTFLNVRILTRGVQLESVLPWDFQF